MPEAREKPAMEKKPDPFDGLVPGRIVHYWPTDQEVRESGVGGPWPAMVTQVLATTPGDVVLNVNLPAQLAMMPDPVQRRALVPYADPQRPHSWSWMFAGQGTRYRSDPPSALPEMKA